MAIIAGWSRGTWSQGAWGESIPVVVTGVAGTGAVGSGSVVAAANVSCLGKILTTSFDIVVAIIIIYSYINM